MRSFLRFGRVRAGFLSPRDLLQRAAVISLAFLAAHLAGLRDFTSVLNGTSGSTTLSWETAALLGVIYIGLYLGFVILVPVLLIAAILLRAGRSLGERKTNGVRTQNGLEHPMGGPASPSFPVKGG